MLQRSPANPLRHAATLGSLGLLLGSAIAPSAFADTARRFVHTTEADFAGGETDGFSVTAFGDLVPAPAFVEGPEVPEGVDTLLAAARVGDAVYAAAGTSTGGARVLQLSGADWAVVAEIDEAQVFCLHAVGDTLLVGVSASDGESRVSALVDGVLRPVLTLPEERYVWSLAGGQNGVPLLVATGTEGRVFAAEVDDIHRAAAGAGDAAAATLVLDSAQANVLALAASPGGFPVYAGTDTDGLVYRIDAAEGDGPPLAVAVFDAPEPEVASLAVATDGRVYVGTADAEQARPGRLRSEASESTGRPDPDQAADAEDAPVGDSNAPDAPPPSPEPIELGQGAQDGQGDQDGQDGQGDQAATPTVNAAPVDTAAPTPAPEAGSPADAPAPSDNNESAESADSADGDSANAPTPENYDALRETLRERLEAAKTSGQLEIDGVAAATTAKSSRPRTRDQPEAKTKEGNAVYELLADGSFREVFRETSMMLALALDADETHLRVGTGSEGELHSIDLSGGGATLVRDLESQQITALLPGADGLLVAASNPASTGLLPAGRPLGEAVYTSASLDAGRTALFGRLGVTSRPGTEGRLLVETRSGATADPQSAPWNPWTQAGTVAMGDPAATLAIPSAPARFLQYRLTLEPSEPSEGDEATSVGPVPTVEEVSLSYAVPNLAPQIQRLELEASSPENPGDERDPVVDISWEASDPDDDALTFEVAWQQAESGRWLTAAENLSDKKLSWDTRALADGLYHVRVTASDQAANPPGSERSVRRRSDVFLVDNTGPALEAGMSTTDAGSPVLAGTASDAAGTVAGVFFRVNDDESFRPLRADDLLFDSAEESFALPLDALDAGESHVVTLRALDARGNATFRTVVVPAR